MNESFKSELKSVWEDLKPKLPVLIFLNILMFGWIYLASSDDVKKERDLAIDSVKAIAWMVSTPECEKRGFCYKIEADKDAGTLRSVTVLSHDHALSKGWSEVQTTTGTYHIHGNPVVTHSEGDAVKLYATKGSQQNVLCINDTCYLVPFLKN